MPNQPGSIDSINPRDIELRLYPSRATMELGEPWECLLRIDNHSPYAIWITAPTTTLTLPAELRHPSEAQVASAGAQLPTVPGVGFDSVMIATHGHYLVLWRMNEDIDSMRTAPLWRRIQWHVFFHPGRYDVQAHMHYWPHQPDMEALGKPILIGRKRKKMLAGSAVEVLKQRLEALMDKEKIESPPAAHDGVVATQAEEESLREETEAKKAQTQVLNQSLVATVTGSVETVTKSSTVLVAAALGGIIAFALRELYFQVNAPARLALLDLFLLPSYTLTSIVGTLFISRVTEARLPLTIRIMDFWGATALGIMAAFAGEALLRWLLESL